MGCGKMTSLDSKILTPLGWVRNGDLRVGDEVCTPNGKTAHIKELYPQGKKDIYRFETMDGRVTDCGLEHLWKIRTKGQIHSYRKDGYDDSKHFSIVRTKDILKLMESGQPVYIPTPIAEFTRKEFIIPPYVFGVLLGDGCLTEKVLTRGCKFLSISNAEEDVLEKVARLTECDGYTHRKGCYTNVFRTPHIEDYKWYLQSVGLCTYSRNRFIPKEYLFGSTTQRRELLQGLFDTDGSVCDGNRLIYSTVSRKLRDDIVYLCRSLGYVVTVNKDNRAYKYRTNEPAYSIRIQTDDKIFSSRKHTTRYEENRRKSNRTYSRTKTHVRIKSITFDRNTEAQCMLLDSKEHLYILDDFITTHNSFAALLMAGYHSDDPNFRMVFLRRNIGDIKAGGGGTDEAQKIYGGYATFKISESPRMVFPSGAFCDFTHMSDQTPDKVLERVKGWQYSCIYIDEATGFEWSTVRMLMSRNRSQAKWSGKMRLTCNPKRNHWLRKWVDWYLDARGYPIPERVGVVRYFFVNGETIDDVIFGDTKEDVYAQCRTQIDDILKGQGDEFTYRDLIKSTTFYTGMLSENKALMQNDSGYLGSVSAMGERQRMANMMQCWNVDLDDDLDLPIEMAAARKVDKNDPQTNGDMWITADIGSTGKDNTVILAWNGLHIINVAIIEKATPRQNAEHIERMAAHYDIPNSHIIYDGTGSPEFLDYLPDAQPFYSSGAPRGKYRREFQKLKDEVFMRLVRAVNEGRISMDPCVSAMQYKHQKLKMPISIFEEFVEECMVVQFDETSYGKKRLYTKVEMNKKLGKDRSMDLIDPCAYRFFPYLQSEYGQELNDAIQKSFSGRRFDDEYVDIYDEGTWA